MPQIIRQMTLIVIVQSFLDHLPLVQLASALQGQKQGVLVATPQQTVSQFLTDWLELTHKHSIRPRTYERYEEAIRLHLIPVLGKYRLQMLSAQHVQAFYVRMT